LEKEFEARERVRIGDPQLGNILFRLAPGLPNALILIDKSGRRRPPVVRVG
jgi:hypothetical protein